MVMCPNLQPLPSRLNHLPTIALHHPNLGKTVLFSCWGARKCCKLLHLYLQVVIHIYIYMSNHIQVCNQQWYMDIYIISVSISTFVQI